MQHVDDFELALAIVGRVWCPHFTVEGEFYHPLTHWNTELVQLSFQVWDLRSTTCLITLILRRLLLLHNILDDLGEEKGKHV